MLKLRSDRLLGSSTIITVTRRIYGSVALNSKEKFFIAVESHGLELRFRTLQGRERHFEISRNPDTQLSSCKTDGSSIADPVSRQWGFVVFIPIGMPRSGHTSFLWATATWHLRSIFAPVGQSRASSVKAETDFVCHSKRCFQHFNFVFLGAMPCVLDLNETMDFILQYRTWLSTKRPNGEYIIFASVPRSIGSFLTPPNSESRSGVFCGFI